ncbi:MAG: magnesium transporter [Gammaproteobacteria bacterium]|nr:magnesium transporter [Gammaproteobacteria bacterium]MBT8135063.1 magnesium transporter [Gammaproteobacteria bacterium]NNJ50053.1 magnesium transporter [Gammaproteobacteria bacterium]
MSDVQAEKEVVPEEALHDAVEAADGQQVADIVESNTSQEVLRQASLMKAAERDQLIAILAPEAAAELIEEAPAGLAANMIEGLDSDVAAKIMEELPSDTQADIVNDIKKRNAESILSAMDADTAEDVRKLSQYAPDTAGGLMERETFTFLSDETVGAVLKRMIADDEEYERYRGQHPYILDQSGRLVGVVSLRGLLRNKRAVLLADIMKPVISVTPDTSQDELVTLFDENPFLGVPVVDGEGSLLGIVSRTELAEAVLERAEHQSLSRQKIGDELRSMPTLLRSRRRLAWLSSNIVLNIIAASVISAYEETLAAVIAIAVFLPMVSDMSGCSGNQAVGVSMRELALGLTRPVDLFHVLRKELSVGIINGIVLGILIGIVAWLWKDNAYLGLVIGLALSVNTLIAVSIGGTVPLMLKNFGIDPAVASGPLLTTVTDMAGFFLVLSLASLFMPQLLA